MNSNRYGQWGGTDGGFINGKVSQQNGFVYNQYKRTFDGNGSYPYLYACSADIEHTHNYDHKHNITSDGGTEARPDNYTVRIWKRIA